LRQEFPARVANKEINLGLEEREKSRSDFKDLDGAINVKEIKEKVDKNVYEVPSQKIVEKMLNFDAETFHFSKWIQRNLV